MTPPRWASALLRRVAPSPRVDDVLGDLEEAHRKRVERRGRALGNLLTAVETCDVALSLMRERVRQRGWRLPGVTSVLDAKLGLRMLVKQPGLTLVAVFALALGIPVGLYPSHLLSAFEAPLPFDQADRIQMLRYVNVVTSGTQTPSLEDFVRWREELTTFEAIGAASRGSSFNVIYQDGNAEPVRGAEVSASVFDILRVPPVLGRTLISDDEVIGMPHVVVVGHDLWKSRLGGDSSAVGRTMRVGGVQRTVVGIMPEGFFFPDRDHLWLPLRANESAGKAGSAELSQVIFGRLSDGISPSEAEVELGTVIGRLSMDFPETHAQLQPEVVPYMIGLVRLPKGGLRAEPEFYALQALALLVLLVACANVGMLIFARTAARSSELAVRTALGASRLRVISQLFTEAVLLAVLAAGVGLLIADRIILGGMTSMDWVMDLFPYWLDFGVTRETTFWALSLAVFSAAVVGVVPALKVTGRGVQQNIQRTVTGRSGMRFGGISSVLIVTDVALAVVAAGVAVAFTSGLTGFRDGMGSLSEEYLSAELTIPRIQGTEHAVPFDTTEFIARVGATQQELVRRLTAEPGVRAVAVGSVLPGMDHAGRRIELDGEDLSDDFWGHRVSIARIDPGFFDALEQPILNGRGFDLGDLGENRSAVLVNTDFVDRVLGGRNPIGRRVRYTTRAEEEPGPWYEIVGVVGPLGTLLRNSEPPSYAGLYHPLALGEIPSLRLAIRVGDDPESFTPRLRAIAGAVDPAAIVSNAVSLDEVVSFTWLGTMLMIWGAGILVGILVAISASGTYALMSFTITERTREIGIRTALGAQRGRVVFTIARRSLAQLGVGILVGTPVARTVFVEMDGGMGRLPVDSPLGITLVVGVSVMFLIGVPAFTAPTLRALRIMPTEALKEGG